MAGNDRPLLVLWDIDHTLIETRGLGTRLYRQAFEVVTGVPVTYDVEVTGRTELAIFAEALQLHGIEPNDELTAGYCVELGKQYEAHAEDLSSVGRALPGARASLEALAGQPNVIQTVLTGNLRAVAVVKLRVFGLDLYIDFEAGAYGEDDAERAKLVAVAQGRTGAKYGTTFTTKNTVVVGDTVNDVIAAHQGGARMVGVASGRDSEEALREAGADEVLADLADISRVVTAVTG